MNCKSCGQPIKTIKFGYVIEKTNNHPLGKYKAYREDGWLSCHYADTEEQVLENAMKELGRCIK